MTKSIASLIIAGIIFTTALVASLVAVWATRPSTALGSSIDTPIYKFDSATSTIIGTNSALVVATSTSRRYLLLQNAGSSTMYCNVNGWAAADQQGFFMTASSSRTFDGSSLYTGAIICIASSSVRVLAVESYL
jgi:hypothetical protein